MIAYLLINKMNYLEIQKLSESAKLPQRATSGSVGYDLFSAENKIINPKCRELINLDISLKIPEGHYGRIAPRSGLSSKKSIDIGAGVIDIDYRGNIMVLMNNNNPESIFEIKKGDKIAQLILEKCSTPEIKEVKELDKTNRGENGFGSTGN